MTGHAGHAPRLFASDAAIERVGLGLLNCSLPRADWTHEGHLGACLWLLLTRPDIDAEVQLPSIISQYNVAVGGINDDNQGYHETLTQLYIAGARQHLAESDPAETLTQCVNRMIAGERGHRAWPLSYYEEQRLFSVAARRTLIAPDRRLGDPVTLRLMDRLTD